MSYMSKMGTAHARRNLHSKFKHVHSGLAIDPYMLALPCDDGTEVKMAALNVYELFHGMCSDDAQKLKSFIGPAGVDGLSDFWSAAAAGTVYRDHPCLSTPESLCNLVPF